MYLAIQEGARGENDGLGPELDAQLRDDTHHAVTFQQQVVHRLLEEGQIGLVLQCLADSLAIQDAICLGACGSNRGPLAGIENAKLNTRLVGGQRHDAAQRIHFLDQMPLANPANGRVAGHLTQGVKIVA